VGVKVSVGVFVNVAVAVGEDVSVGVNVNLGVLVGRRVLVGLGVLVGLEVFVGFGVLLGLGAASTTAGACPRKDTSIKKIIVNRLDLSKNVFIAGSSLRMVIDEDRLHPTLHTILETSPAG
jgi:UDP-3-O-[3-hydroxymyristoyl] glucosamine N-acyltransferase